MNVDSLSIYLNLFQFLSSKFRSSPHTGPAHTLLDLYLSVASFGADVNDIVY